MAMNNIKEEMRKLVETMEEINEAPIPEDLQLQQAYRHAQQGMKMFMSRVKKLDRMANDFQGSEDLKLNWQYSLDQLHEEIDNFFRSLSN